MARQYRVGEFADRTRVSVRTLHHYDEIGLLSPSGRTESGHRLYSEEDLLTLQQILTLRYLGFPLKQIATLLGRPDFDLVASMQIQRHVVRQRIAQLQHVELMLGHLLERRAHGGEWAWDQVAGLAAALEAHLNTKGEGIMEQYYTPEQMQRWKELGELVPVEERVAVEEEWTALLRDVRAARDLDPASTEAQALAERWDRAMANMRHSYESRGYGDLLQAVGQNYQQGKFEGHPQAPQAADFAFIEAARNARPAS